MQVCRHFQTLLRRLDLITNYNDNDNCDNEEDNDICENINDSDIGENENDCDSDVSGVFPLTKNSLLTKLTFDNF